MIGGSQDARKRTLTYSRSQRNALDGEPDNADLYDYREFQDFFDTPHGSETNRAPNMKTR